MFAPVIYLHPRGLGGANATQRLCPPLPHTHTHTHTHTQVESLVQDGSFWFENCQVKVWRGKVRRRGCIGRAARQPNAAAGACLLCPPTHPTHNAAAPRMSRKPQKSKKRKHHKKNQLYRWRACPPPFWSLRTATFGAAASTAAATITCDSGTFAARPWSISRWG